MKIICKLFFILSLGLGLSYYGLAQPEAELDKIKQLYATSKQASKQLEYLKQINERLENTYQAERLDYALKALDLARELDSLPLAMEYESYISFIYYDYGDYEQALEYAIANLRTARKLKNYARQASALSSIAYYNAELGDKQKAIKYGKDALKILEKVKDSTYINMVYNDLGEIFYVLEEYDQAIEYLEKSLEVNQRRKHAYNIAFSQMNLAHYYIAKKDYQTAFGYATKAYKEIEKGERKINFAFLLIDMGIIEREFGNFEQAETYLNRALEIGKKAQAKAEIASCYRELSELASQQQVFDRGLSLYKLYKTYEDSIYNEKRLRQFSLMQASLERERQIYENEQLRQQNDLQQATIRNQQLLGLVMVILLVSVVSVLMLLVRNYRQKRLTAHIIQEQNQALLAQNARLIQLDQEKSDLMHIVAHDLKAPLNRVKGLANLLQHEELSANQEEYINLMLNVVDQGRDMIQELLDLQRLESQEVALEIESINLNELLQNILLGFEKDASNKNIQLNLNTKPETEEISTDPALLERIMDNLLSNAIKFSHANSKINISLEAPSGSEYLCISVEDEGQGFSEEDKQHIFKKFTRLSAKPTDGEDSSGLGLYIVKLLVETLRGKISLQSTLGEGSRFDIQLPRHLNLEEVPSPEIS